MRIVLLNLYYHPDVAATAQLLSDVGAALAARGHEVTALTSAQPYAEAVGRRAFVDEHAGVRIWRVPTTRFGRGWRIGRALDYAGFVAGAMPALAALRPDVTVALSTPPLVAVLPMLARLRYVYWVMDVYPDVAVALGALPAGGLVTGAMAQLEARVRRHAARVVALDDAMATRLRSAGVGDERLAVIDNWAPFEAAPAAPARNGRLRVGYHGNLGLGHDVETLLAAMRTADVDWRFVGGGPRRELVASVAARGEVTIAPYVPLTDLPAELAAVDVSLVSLDARLAGLVAPSKLYAALAAGLPIVYVGPDEGRAAEVVRAGAGIRVANGDSAGLVAALERLRDSAERHRLAAAARAAATRFRRTDALARHVAVIEAAAC
jgi:glycosyltransferase involved in cell wall biosynthesis